MPSVVVCEKCGTRFTDEQITALIVKGLKQSLDEMEEKNEHISNYSQYAMTEELYKIFSEKEGII